MDNQPILPISVDTSPVPAMVMAGVRQTLTLAGSALATSGYVNDNTWGVVSGIVVAIVPIIWGQIATRWPAVQLAALACDPKVPQVQPK